MSTLPPYLKMGEIVLNENLKITVGCYWSKFVKLQTPKKTLSLSEHVWGLITDKLELINASFESAGGSADDVYTLVLNDTKFLKVETFRGQRGLAFGEKFEKDGKALTKWLSLSKQEWQTLQEKMPTIRRLLDYDVVYKLHDVAGEEAGFSMLRVGNSMMHKLVPRMCPKTFVWQVYVYLITQAVDRSLKEDCSACSDPSIPMDDARHTGHGVLAWHQRFGERYDTIRASIPAVAAIERINTAMGWAMPIDLVPDEKRLRETLSNYRATHFNHMPQGTCSECQELMELYWDMYETLIKEQQ